MFMDMSHSHDGFALGFVERSAHLEEYTRMRPASAGSRPRSLLNKVANAAAAAQADDDPEPADAEPWVLEGWGDGPSVSEAAQQAALRLAPYAKNVPTTLVGLGAGGRRVLSAGPQGRSSPLKVSEARRKPGPGPPHAQGDRRASGPAGLATATVRRAPPLRDLDVGDESDVEPDTAAAAGAGSTSGYAHTLVHGQPPRGGPGQRGPPLAPTAATRQYHVALAQQAMQHPGGMAARIGRRDIASPAAPAAAPQPLWGTTANEAPSNSPRYRSLSAEAYHNSSGGAGTGAAAAAASSSRPGAPPALRGGAAAPSGAGAPPPHPQQHTHSHPPLPPQPPHGHLDPLSPTASRNRGAPGPSDPGVPADGRNRSSECQPPLRSSSFTSYAQAALTTGLDNIDIISAHLATSVNAFTTATPAQLQQAQAASQRSSSPNSSTAGAQVHPPPPPLPGLFPSGRKIGSFRADTGLCGWDPEGPSMQVQQIQLTPAQAASNVSLWIGPMAPGTGTSGLQVGTVSSGRGTSMPGNNQPPHRRDQLPSN
ncbi:hypothetical protein Agub_g1648, partial [Astrephomene gubernaculifera]